ncbi:MAG: tetraacyldisaccharide 4'-kinase [Acidithiobacillus sp.]|uniref:tetraacyldisaccharide 4'-kinase n=1 Tax=Acidithiobacillus sp. TaxID=1872118 RepID=UPI003CFF4150
MKGAALLERQWRDGGPLATALRPLGAITCALAGWRRRHAHGRPAVLPSIVVGNLPVGGSGKTPLVMAIAAELAARGWRPAIVSRGYGAHPPHHPYAVQPGDPPRRAGDEPLLLRQVAPVYLSPRRLPGIAAAAAGGATVAVLDDGFQHLALQARVQLLVFSGARPLGNGRCLPAGPLREPLTGMAAADALLVDAAADEALSAMETPRRFRFRIVPVDLALVRDPAIRQPLSSLQDRAVSALSGIARPERFAALLASLGARVHSHFFADHHPFSARDLADHPRPIVMTAKDAVKCRAIAGPDDWFLRIRAELETPFWDWLAQRLP